MENRFSGNSAPLNDPMRPSSLDVRGTQPTLFPFDAFQFEDPNRTENPNLTMKDPWTLVADTIKSSGNPWNYQGVVAHVPEGAYFSGMRSPDDDAVALLNKQDDNLLGASSNSLNVGWLPHTVSGSVSYDLTGIPEYVSDGGYTIIVHTEKNGWDYLSGSGASFGASISKVGDVFTIASSNILPQLIPFRLYGGVETFRDLIVIPQNYTETDIHNLIDGVGTFSWEEGSMSADRGFVLSPDGFYWYNGGQYIKLGTEAIFAGVNMKSGQWDGTFTNGEITSNGTAGWALSSKGDFEANDGTFRGTLDAADGSFHGNLEISSDNSSRYLSIGDKGLYVEDENNVVLHDLVDSPVNSDTVTMGHLYANGNNSSLSLGPGYVSPSSTWYDLQADVQGNTNVHGVLLSAKLVVTNGTTDNTFFVTARFKKRTGGWANYLPNITLYFYGRHNSATQTLVVPVDLDGYFSYNVDISSDAPSTINLSLLQLGFYV